MTVQTLVSKATVERFYEGVIGGFARARECQSDFVAISPKVRNSSCEFASVIAEDFLGCSPFSQDLI